MLAVESGATVSYWVIYLLVVIAATALPAAFVAAYRQLRHSGAWEETRQEMLKFWPDMMKARSIVLGDQSQWPPTASLASTVSELSAQVKEINRMLATGNGHEIGAVIASIDITLQSLRQDLKDHVASSEKIHRDFAREIGQLKGQEKT